MNSLVKNISSSTRAGLAALWVLMAATPTWGQEMVAKLRAAHDAGELPGLHSVVVTLGGTRIGEAYFPGEDESWGVPLGVVDHGPDTLHDLRSVTKSVVGLLYGIALDRGLVPDPDTTLLDAFPDYPDLRDGTAREDILVRHVLTMQMGTHWDESLPYSDPRNSEIAMERAEDRYRFVLAQPMVGTPGEGWTYSGGAVALLGKLIADGTGMTLDEFAREALFTPLGIDRFEWARGADGVPSAASGLRLTARDLARIGQMVADTGQFDGRRVVSGEWLRRSLTPAATIDEGFHYGFLWYLASGPGGDRIAIGLGNGGQRMTVQPKVGFVAVNFAGRYNDFSAWKLSLDVLLKHAVPAATAHLKR